MSTTQILVHCILMTAGFAPVPDCDQPTYERKVDKRFAIICNDGRVGTFQGGGSSRTVDIKTFERDYCGPSRLT